MEEQSANLPEQTPGRMAWLADASNIDLPAVDALVEGLIQVQRQVATLQALEASMLSAAVDVVAETMAARGIDDDQQLPWRELSAEVAAALRVSDRTMQTRMGDAAALVQGFPAVHAALGEGRIDRARARTIVDVGSSLPAGSVRAKFEAESLSRAEDLTAGRLGAACRSIADRLDPDSIDERHARAKRRRRVGITDLDDGMARLFADLPAALARAIFDRVTQMAKTVQHGVGESVDAAPDASADAAGGTETGGADAGSIDARAGTDSPGAGGGGRGTARTDERSLDQIRADVLSDMLLTSVPTGHGPADVFTKIAAHVQVIVPAELLDPSIDTTGAATRGDGDILADPHIPDAFPRIPTPGGRDTVAAATLAGSGPIDTATARTLASAVRNWDRMFTDPYSGGVLCVDRHDPNKHLKRLLGARDEHCRFPGCRQPVWRCEIDHTNRYRDGGPTCRCNLEHLCKGHHILKHHTRWNVRQLGGGVLEWTSPTGRLYIDTPAPMVRFVDTTPHPPDPPPF
jgi:hypothetical protein